MIKKIILFAFFWISVSASAPAIEKPTPEEVQTVINYYFSKEKTAPVLLDSKLCENYVRSGEEKLECEGEISDNKTSYGTDIYVWLNFFWNKGQSYNIIVNYDYNNLTRRTYEISLPKNGSIRYRIPLIFHANKKGEWDVNIFYDDGKTPLMIKEFKIEVL